ncbi:RAMP superfamily CRISPR-associated protein [Nostoc sp. CHAB 5844]|nr:RAMP superfamily CRISPR-associated protein [Nostoc sp. CHAB 5844]
MHKRFVNRCTIDLTLIPNGPILIKSGKEGADPTKPDMEFVETYHAGGRSIYLPGSSLKGAIRAHAERVVRTVGDEKPNSKKLPWANDPLSDKYDYLKNRDGKDLPAPDIYKLSSFTDQIFGNTSIASRIRIEDAYPDKSQPLKIEERNGVAIDRVFGSTVPGALFNYQVCTAGEFKTKIHLKNFTLSQLGLIGLVLRDLNDGWFGLGFAKSRGLGTVKVEYKKAVVQYPGCILRDGRIHGLKGNQNWSNTMLLGAGEFVDDADVYGFPKSDYQDTPVAAEEMDFGFGVQLIWREGRVTDLFERAVRSWKDLLLSTAR